MNTNAKKNLRWAAVLAVAVLSAILPLATVGQNSDDPPGRAARIRYIQGSVSFHRRAVGLGSGCYQPTYDNRGSDMG